MSLVLYSAFLEFGTLGASWQISSVGYNVLGSSGEQKLNRQKYCMDYITFFAGFLHHRSSLPIAMKQASRKISVFHLQGPAEQLAFLPVPFFHIMFFFEVSINFLSSKVPRVKWTSAVWGHLHPFSGMFKGNLMELVYCQLKKKLWAPRTWIQTHINLYCNERPRTYQRKQYQQFFSMVKFSVIRLKRPSLNNCDFVV